MKIEYINPFIEASKSIINQTTGFLPEMGKPYVKEAPYKGNNVLVLIGLTGEIHGSAVIIFSNDVACKIAAAMMMVESISELDEIAKSAISELCNMILGNTATIFSQKGINIDITPPTMLTGDNMELTVHKNTVISIPLIFEDNSKMEIDISYIEK